MSETRHYYTSTVASAGLGSSSNSKETNSSSEPYLGFANLPKQVHRKSVKKGFEFTLMVVGEAGLGKSTLINALFCSQLYKNRKIGSISIDQLPQTVEITSQQVEIEERGVKLKLTVVDTPGFGETIDGRECIKPICNYIDQQFERFLEYESGLNRKHVTDTRVHCCFYFVSPIGHGLRPIDVYALKQLQNKVNVIPIIAKADCLTRDELTRFKKRLLNELQTHKIQVYAIPDCDSDEEPEFKEQVQQLRAALPFAVSASLDTVDVIRKTHARQYSWGTVEMENPLHSDFVKLRSLLVTHMQDLREMTNEAHYENYRSERLARRVSGSDVSVSSEPIEREQNKDRILQEKEEELRKMQQMIAQMQQQMHRQHIQDAN